VIRPMQHELNRACHAPREVHRRAEGSAGGLFAWAGLIVIVMLLAAVFAAGVSAACVRTQSDLLADKGWRRRSVHRPSLTPRWVEPCLHAIPIAPLGPFNRRQL
jgi:hypothetical protein